MENLIETQNAILADAIRNDEEDPHWIILEYIRNAIRAWKKKAGELLNSISDELAENEEKVKAAKICYRYKKEKIEEEIAFVKEKCESCENFLKEHEKTIGSDSDISFFTFADTSLVTATEIKTMVEQCKSHFEGEMEVLRVKYREAEAEEIRACDEIRNSLPHIEIHRQAKFCLEQAEKLEKWITKDEEYDDYRDVSDEDDDYSDAYDEY